LASRKRDRCRRCARPDGALRRPVSERAEEPEDWRAGRERPRSPLPSVARP
jgi:hypothetical protein